MNLVDITLVVLAVVAGLAGWRQGLIGGVLSFTGFIVGALAGAALAPMLLSSFSGWLAAALGIAIVLVAAGIGNALAGLLGRAMRERVTWKPARVIDSVGGSMFGVLSMALIAWVVASALVDALTTRHHRAAQGKKRHHTCALKRAVAECCHQERAIKQTARHQCPQDAEDDCTAIAQLEMSRHALHTTPNATAKVLEPYGLLTTPE